MIDIKTLRIGNYLLLDGKPEKVWGIDLDLMDEHLDRISIGDYDMHPVCWIKQGELGYLPVTNDLVLNLGLELVEKDAEYNEYELDYGCFIIRIFDDHECWWINSAGFKSVKLKYIHQIQNLYFALENKELVI